MTDQVTVEDSVNDDADKRIQDVAIAINNSIPDDVYINDVLSAMSGVLASAITQSLPEPFDTLENTVKNADFARQIVDEFGQFTLRTVADMISLESPVFDEEGVASARTLDDANE